MKKDVFLERYGILQNDRAKSPQEKKDRISFLKGSLNNRSAIASNSLNKNLEQRLQNQGKRLDRFAKKSGLNKYEVFVSGKFKYRAVVNASNDADAERLAKNEVAHAAPALELSDVKTNKPLQPK